MMSRMKQVGGLVLLLVIALVLVGCSGQAQPAASSPEATEPAEALPPVRSDTSVMAEGKVVPAQDAALSFQANGVVGEVLVSEGEQVQAGQVLIRLQGSEKLESALATAELEMLSAEQALVDLSDNAAVIRSQTQLTLAEAKRELDKAEDRLYSKEYKRGDQEQIDIARANYVIAEDAVGEAEEQYDRVDDRDEDDPVRAEALSQLAATRQKRDSALYNLNYLMARPNELDVNEIDAKLAVAQAKVADAERRLSLMADGPDKNQLKIAEARLKNARLGVEAARSALKDLELTAPFAGTITSLNITSGEFASPGVAVVGIADFSTLLVETTDLTELNVDKVKAGQPAMVRFDALPGVDIIGRVTRIKPLGENRQGDVVYTVVLKLEKADERLKWNMTASVTFLDKNSLQQ